MRKDAPSIALFHATISRKNRANIHDAVIEISPQSWNEIVGPTDAGKTALFSQLCLRDRPTGSLLVAGMNAARMTASDYASAKRNIASCGQTPFLIGSLSAFENAKLGAEIRGEDVDEECYALFDELGLHDQARQKVRDLNATDRLLVGLVRTVVGTPDVVMIDGIFDMLPRSHVETLVKKLKLRQMAGAAIVIFGRSPTSNSFAGEIWELNHTFESTNDGTPDSETRTIAASAA